MFFKTGSTKGINAKHALKIRLVLSRIDDANVLEDINFNGANLHPLQGNLKGHYSVKVSGNWRITFMFKDGNATIVNYIDYH